MAPTLRDIAERANVSRTAVSFALRGTGRLEESTRKKIISIATDLGYRPNLLVQGIQTGKTQTIGVNFPQNSEFYNLILSGIQDELIRSDYVAITMGRHDEIKRIDHVHHLIDRRVDGVIMAPHIDNESDEYLRVIRDRNLPVVTVDVANRYTRNLDFVGTNDLRGGKLAAEHLLSLGHRRIAVLEHTGLGQEVVRRSKSFQNIMEKVPGIQCDCYRIKTPEQIAEIISLICRGPGRPTAIFATLDRMCPPIFDAAKKSGLRIPEDLSVIGYSGIEWGYYLTPKLTTIRQHPEKIGKEAVRILMKKINGETADNETIQVRMDPELLLRESTTAPPDQTD